MSDTLSRPSGAPPPGEGEPLIAGSSMHERYGGLLKTLFELLFGPMHYPAANGERIRELSQGGVVVYVARARSLWLALYFNFALSRLGLPLARFVGGINLLLWQPIDRLWRLWRQRSRPVTGAWRERFQGAEPSRSACMLATHVFRGEAAFLFLRGEVESLGYLRALVAAQRVSARPIHLVPHAVASQAQGGTPRASLAEILFGTRRRRRGRYVGLTMMAFPGWRSRRAAVRVADPINLRDYCAEQPQLEDGELASRLHQEINRRISDEERVIAGPEMPTPEQLERHVMRAPALRERIAAEATRSGKPVAAIEARAKRYVHEIAARYHPPTTAWMARTMWMILSRIYDGVVIDEGGLARVMEAARRGSIVFCPSHRSHVDYLLMSTVLWVNGYTPPHIAAGANLSFFPLGALFRRAGAFFLRRSFRDNQLYSEVFRAYLAELVRHGTALEFFIEGTRSRTGKVLMPKLGLVGMVVDAWRRGVRDDVWFAPVSVDYERIIEASAYERELKGGQKQPEDIGGLLKTTRVLRSRYGRVHVQFAEPISLKELALRRGLPQDPDPAHDEPWRQEVERLGYRVLHQVATCSSVTPTAVTATALLSHAGRGIAEGRLIERCLELIDYLDTSLARLSAALLDPEDRPHAVREAVQSFVADGAVTVDRAGRADAEPIYRVLEDRRIQLDYFKNALMNYVAPAALTCRALKARGLNVASYADLHRDTRFLSRLFKREFLYRADSAFETYFDETLATLAVRGCLDAEEDGRVVVREREAVALLAGLVDALIEAYWITASTLPDLNQFPMWHQELVTRTMERARRAYLEGRISRPEAANVTVVDNAVHWLLDAGVIEPGAAGKKRPLRLTREYTDGGLERLIGDIAAFL